MKQLWNTSMIQPRGFPADRDSVFRSHTAVNDAGAQASFDHKVRWTRPSAPDITHTQVEFLPADHPLPESLDTKVRQKGP